MSEEKHNSQDDQSEIAAAAEFAEEADTSEDYGIKKDPQAQEIEKQLTQMHAGASWFYWIAGLSIVNAIIPLLGQDLFFIFGLGSTLLINAIAYEIGSSAIAIGFLLNLIIVGFFALFGLLSKKGSFAAFVIGIILYTLDTLLAILVQDWLTVAFHAYVLYRLFRGCSSAMKLKKFDS